MTQRLGQQIEAGEAGADAETIDRLPKDRVTKKGSGCRSNGVPSRVSKGIEFYLVARMEPSRIQAALT